MPATKTKRILSWSPNWSQRGGGGRWRKIIDGKAHFFGHADSPDDTRSYREAERKYLEFMQRRERSAPIYVEVGRATMHDVTEKYCQTLEERYHRQDISASHLIKSVSFLQNFVDFIGSDRPFLSVKELELNDYRLHSLRLPVSPQRGKRISMATARDRLATVKSFYCWAWEMHLCDMPRNMPKYTHCEMPRPKVKLFTIDEVRTLWEKASLRLRCCMALALNCGYGQTDISDLKVSDVDWENGVIDRSRSKSGVHQRHKLWSVTLKLLKECRAPNTRADDLVFRTAKGYPLVHDEAIGGKRRKSDAVKCMFFKLQRKLGINGGRSFYCLRKTAATEIEKINPLVTETFLAHAERGMKRHYAERHFELLDEALGVMEGVVGLSLAAS